MRTKIAMQTPKNYCQIVQHPISVCCGPTDPTASTTVAIRRSVFRGKISMRILFSNTLPIPTDRAHDGIRIKLNGVLVGSAWQRKSAEPPRRVKICVCKVFVVYIGVSLAGVRLCIGHRCRRGGKRNSLTTHETSTALNAQHYKQHTS